MYLQGPYGVGKQTAAEAFARALGAGLLVVDGGWLATRPEEEFLQHVRLIDREAHLQGASLHWKDFDALLGDDRSAQLAALLEMLEHHPGPTFLAGDTPWEPVDALADTDFVRVVLPQPGYGERLALWRNCLGDGIDPEAVANTFRLSGGQIRDAVATARGLAMARQPADPKVSPGDLHAACRLQSNRKLAQLAQKIDPHYTWNDIVLPLDQMAQLREIADQVRYRAVVHDAWGFDAKLAMGKGINVLFSGPPGTGKTMAAEVLAGDLGARPVQDRPVRRRQQVHRGDREEPVAHLHRGANEQRDPVLRRGRCAVRQAHAGARRPRPLRQHGDQLLAAADGGVRRAS